MSGKIRYKEKHGSILGGKVKCYHCGRESKGSEVTYRFLESERQFEPAVQGPLCANCSELPPGKMPWKRGHRW